MQAHAVSVEYVYVTVETCENGVVSRFVVLCVRWFSIVARDVKNTTKYGDTTIKNSSFAGIDSLSVTHTNLF
jgi:hypothetical protein